MDTQGHLDLLLKVYFPNSQHPHGGVMSMYLYSLEVGSRLKISGPEGHLVYEKDGLMRFLKENKSRKYKKFSFIGGGSGVTPLYQVIQHLLDERHHQFDLRLLLANVTEADILIRERLDDLKRKGLVKVGYTLDSPHGSWHEFKGFVNEIMISEFFHKPSPDHLALI